MKKFILAAVCCLSFSHMYGQAVLLERGQSGTNLGAGFQTGRSYSGFQTGIGYTPNGITNIGTYVAYNSINDTDFSELTINPFIEVLVVKKDKQNPINVGLSFNYNYTHVMSETLDFLGVSLNSHGLSSSLTISPDIEAAQNLRVLPFGSFGYNYRWLTASDGFYSETDGSGRVFGRLGTILAFMNGDNAFSIAPSVSFSRGSTGFVLFVSYNFAGKS